MRVHTGCVFALLAPLFALLAPGCASEGQRQFSSPEEAATSLVAALRTNDQSELAQILGPGNEDLISSGDEVNDRNTRDLFVKAYDTKHAVTTSAQGAKTLVVGADDWPLPIPIVQDTQQSTWSFDSQAGRDEIINRRIGENELAAIRVCRAIIDAQLEYAAADPDANAVHDYSQKFASDVGPSGAPLKNGLHWRVAPGERQSPLGELVSAAAAEGYTRPDSGEPVPYHGYHYRILTAQGSSATGGARDYISNGKMTGGAAVVAFPAVYGSSGIMTFIAKLDGVVYEQDLGEDSTSLGHNLKAFDPDSAWRIVEAE